MKKYILLSILSLMLSTSIYANSVSEDYCCPTDFCVEQDCGFYANVFGGANFMQFKGSKYTNNKVGYVVSGSLGYRVAYGIRTEFEYAYRRNRITPKKRYLSESDSIYSVRAHAHNQTHSFMANAIWDIPLSNACYCYDIVPFIGAGIGYDSQKISFSARNENYSLSDSTTKGQFAWQILAGLGYPICDNTLISVEYKMHKGASTDIYNHSIGAGVIYKFN